jgi:hypothetical protein
MSPIDKWRKKSKPREKIPFNLGVQILKMILVTAQLVIFSSEMSRYLTHQGNIGVTFREIMLVNWDSVREVMSYPPAAGPYAIYTKDEFYESLDHAIRTFANISHLTIGSFGYAIPFNQSLIQDQDLVYDYQDYNGKINYLFPQEDVKNIAPDENGMNTERESNLRLNKTRDRIKKLDGTKLNSTINGAQDKDGSTKSEENFFEPRIRTISIPDQGPSSLKDQ